MMALGFCMEELSESPYGKGKPKEHSVLRELKKKNILDFEGLRCLEFGGQSPGKKGKIQKKSNRYLNKDPLDWIAEY